MILTKFTRYNSALSLQYIDYLQNVHFKTPKRWPQVLKIPQYIARGGLCAERMQPLSRKISRSRLQPVRTRSSSFQVQVAFWAAFTILLHFLASLQLESNLNSESLQLDSPMASVHRRYACMGCTARGGEPAPPTFSTTINRPPLTMRAAKVAANPVEG